MVVRPGGDNSSTRVALGAAVGGLASALLTAFLNRTLLLDERASEATTLGAIGFVVVLAAPFVLVLLAFFLPDAEQRRAVWLAGAMLALIIGGLSIFSAGVLFLIVAGALGWAWWATRMGLKPACIISRTHPRLLNVILPVLRLLKRGSEGAGDQPTGLRATRGG